MHKDQPINGMLVCRASNIYDLISPSHHTQSVVFRSLRCLFEPLWIPLEPKTMFQPQFSQLYKGVSRSLC